MSYLDDIKTKMYKDMFIEDYRTRADKVAMVKAGCMPFTDVIGASFQIPISEGWDLVDRGAENSLINFVTPGFDTSIASPKNKAGAVAIDIYQQAETNVSIMQQEVKQAVDAVARAELQEIIRAMNTSTTSNIVLDGGTNLPIEKISKAREELQTNNADDGNIFMLMHASQLRSLLNQEKATSADYVNIKALVSGETDTFYGFKVIVLGNVSTGGLPKTGNIRTIFAWNQSSMANVWWRLKEGNPNIDVYYNRDRKSDIISPQLKFGAQNCLPKGLVKINCDETL